MKPKQRMDRGVSKLSLDIQGVFKQAVLKRGLPMKLVIDNGAAYRAGSLKGLTPLDVIANCHRKRRKPTANAWTSIVICL